MITNPQRGQEVFFTYKGDLRKGVVDAIKTHATAGTPYCEVIAHHDGREVRPSLHPDFLFRTEEEASREDIYAKGLSYIDRYIADRTEYAKIAGHPPTWVTQQRRVCQGEFKLFKNEQAGRAVQAIVPGITIAEANKRFAEGMQIFAALRAAHKHFACDEYTAAMLEEVNVKNHGITPPEALGANEIEVVASGTVSMGDEGARI